MPKQDDKKTEERRQAALKQGRFAAAESDDNSVFVSDDGYVGTAPEYRNAANEVDRPLQSEDEDQKKIEEAAKEDERLREVAAAKVGFRGYAPETPHPSERTQPASVLANQQRDAAAGFAALGKAAEAAAEEQKSKADEEQKDSSPGIAGS